MSILGIGSSATAATAAVGVRPEQALTLGVGGGAPGQMALPGAAMAQPGGALPIIKKILIGGAVGAAAGFGIGLLPNAVPIVGPWLAGKSALIGAAAGAGIGILAGIVGTVRSRKLGMKAQQQQQAMATQMPGMSQPNALPPPLKGRTYKVGAKQNNDVKFTQRALKSVGLYNGKLTGTMDRATANAIRKYEMLKGALPTGRSTPDLRAALYQDMRLTRQFG